MSPRAKNILTITLILSVSLVILYLMRSCNASEYTQSEPNTQNPITIVHDTIKTTHEVNHTVYKKDPVITDNLQSIINQLRADSSQKAAYSVYMANEIDRLNEELTDATTKIKSLSNINTSLELKLKGLQSTKLGSSYFSEFADVNGWYSGNVKFDLIDTTFSVSVKSKDEYNVVFYSQDGKSLVKVENKNPYVLVNGMNSFIVPELKKTDKVRRFGVGLNLGYGVYYNRYNKFQTGFGLQTGLYYKIW